MAIIKGLSEDSVLIVLKKEELEQEGKGLSFFRNLETYAVEVRRLGDGESICVYMKVYQI